MSRSGKTLAPRELATGAAELFHRIETDPFPVLAPFETGDAIQHAWMQDGRSSVSPFEHSRHRIACAVLLAIRLAIRGEREEAKSYSQRAASGGYKTATFYAYPRYPSDWETLGFRKVGGRMRPPLRERDGA
jgi:hypothetical protein